MSLIFVYFVYFIILFALFYYAIIRISDDVPTSFGRLIMLSLTMLIYIYFSYENKYFYNNISLYVPLIISIIIYFLLKVNFIDYLIISTIVWIWTFALYTVLDDFIWIVNNYYYIFFW